MDLDKIIAQAKDLKQADLFEGNVAEEILRVSKLIYEDNVDMHPWYRGVDMITKLQHLGKANVRTHLEKLSDKGRLEKKLHGTKVVYRLHVVSNDD